MDAAAEAARAAERFAAREHLGQLLDGGYDVEAKPRVAKVVATGELGYDTAPMPIALQEQVLEEVRGAVSGMNRLQLARDRGVVATSMKHALGFLRNQLGHPHRVHVADPNTFAWFHHETYLKFYDETYDTTLLLGHYDDTGTASVWISPVFQQFRQRDTAVWAIRVRPSDLKQIADDRTAHWCLVVANFTTKRKTVVPRGKVFAYDDTCHAFVDRYFDRELVDVQFFDPLEDCGLVRSAIAKKVTQVLGTAFGRAGIAYRDTQLHEHLKSSGYAKVEHLWQTGYQVYAIAREYFRRLALLENISAGSQTNAVRDRLIRADYNGLIGIDAAREEMMVGCAARAIVLSDYEARVAIELPGFSTGHSSADLRPDAIDRFDDAEEVVGSERIFVHEYQADCMELDPADAGQDDRKVELRDVQ